ncbi:MAG TPA: 5-(carboxyamino)imidazole ribonucleotide mutase [Firmicutes bacterium]|nr:5-(carboxyamino)imidazole ribonucleotide mutase [Bacillota bacterium]
MSAKVGVVFGSETDIPVMRQVAETLDSMGVEYEANIISAHRSPALAIEYARTAQDRGIEVIIAGAGLAAHLPGTMAAWTTVPVIGIPVKAGALSGLDALLSIAQMPPGVPVATVGIDGAKNAALLACEILALKYPEIASRLAEMRRTQAEKIGARRGIDLLKEK